MVTKSEHRKYIRYAVRLPVQLTAGQTCITGYSTDLSINGLYLIPEQPLPTDSVALIGSTADIRLSLATTTIDASCTIRRVTSSGIGISLHRLDAKELADIEALCAVEEEGIEAVICGRAIYTGDLDFEAAQIRADELNG